MTSALAVLVLLAAVWPFAALLKEREFRLAFPALTKRLAVCLVGYAVLAGLGAVFAPRATVWLGIVAAVGIAVQWWRSRPDFGKSRGLPPGSLTLVPADMWLRPNFFLEQYRKYGPVFKVSHFLHPMVCVIGFDTAFEFLSKYEEVEIRSPEPPFSRYIPRGFIRCMMPADHSKYRPILQAAISSEVTEGCGAAARAAAAECLSSMAGACGAGESGESLKKHAQGPMYELLFRMFFGIEAGSAEAAELRKLYEVVDLGHRRYATRVLSPPDPEVERALQSVYALLRRQVAKFAAAGNRPAESYLESAWRHGGEAAVDEVVLAEPDLLAQASCTDLVSLWVWILKQLSVHPEWQDRLRELMRTHGNDSPEAADLASRIVTETYRLEQSEHIYRRVVKPVEIGGYHVPKGWLVRICVRETHRSSASFDEPEQFNPDRYIGRTYGPTEYAPFGLYRKRCIGVHTVWQVGTSFVKELVAGYEWQVTDVGVQDYRGWHWTPGSGFAVCLRPVRAEPAGPRTAVR